MVWRHPTPRKHSCGALHKIWILKSPKLALETTSRGRASLGLGTIWPANYVIIRAGNCFHTANVFSAPPHPIARAFNRSK